MFLGEDTHALDDKGRLVMPSRYRADLADGCVVAAGRRRQLNVFPLESYLAAARDLRSRERTTETEREERLFFGMADQQTLDKSGRLLIKPELRGVASLEPGSPVVIVGQFDRIELWTPAAYELQRRLSEQMYFVADDEEVATAS